MGSLLSMPFEIKNKVALISGGASALGFTLAKELLKADAKAVCICDISEESGTKARQRLEKEFGEKKIIFIMVDVTDGKSYEGAFIATVDKFRQLDIVINAAGVFNDATWQREVNVNLNGTVHGTLLALDKYIPKYRTAVEGVIVNISSIEALQPNSAFPIYCATKLAVLAMSTAFGAHYAQSRVKVLTVCPGVTTPILDDLPDKTLGMRYKEIALSDISNFAAQSPELVAEAVIGVIKNAQSGTVWVVEEGREAYKYKLPLKEYLCKTK